jgi:hypothetical protein
MRTGQSWLIAGIAGALLIAPAAARAQGNRGTAPGDTPAAPAAPTRSSGTGPVGSFNPPPAIHSGQPVSVLVFPFGYAADMAAPAATAVPMPDAGATGIPVEGPRLTPEQEAVAAAVTAHVKAGLLSSPFYSVASYHQQSSLIQRGRKDDILRPEMLTDLVSPMGVVDAEKAKTVTYRLGIQAYMVGTLDVKEDAKTNTVEITLETQIVDSSNGQVIHSAAVSGAAAGAEGVPIDQIRERAAQDAAQKALPALGIQMVALTTAPPPGAKDKKGADKTRKTEAEKKADREAKKKADDARAQAERDAKAKKKADEKARREGEKGATTSSSTEKHDGSAILVANAAPAPAAAAPPPAAGTPPPSPASGNVPGYGNAAGQPIPYSYAGNVTTLKTRHKKSIRVPSLLGIAGFLTGISFLL